MSVSLPVACCIWLYTACIPCNFKLSTQLYACYKSSGAAASPHQLSRCMNNGKPAWQGRVLPLPRTRLRCNSGKGARPCLCCCCGELPALLEAALQQHASSAAKLLLVLVLKPRWLLLELLLAPLLLLLSWLPGLFAAARLLNSNRLYCVHCCCLAAAAAAAAACRLAVSCRTRTCADGNFSVKSVAGLYVTSFTTSTFVSFSPTADRTAQHSMAWHGRQARSKSCQHPSNTILQCQAVALLACADAGSPHSKHADKRGVAGVVCRAAQSVPVPLHLKHCARVTIIKTSTRLTCGCLLQVALPFPRPGNDGVSCILPPRLAHLNTAAAAKQQHHRHQDSTWICQHCLLLLQLKSATFCLQSWFVLNLRPVQATAAAQGDCWLQSFNRGIGHDMLSTCCRLPVPQHAPHTRLYGH